MEVYQSEKNDSINLDLENEISFYLIRSVHVYTEEKIKIEDYDPEYDDSEYDYEKHTKFYESTSRRFFPKSIDDILAIEGSFQDCYDHNTIEVSYKILVAKKYEFGYLPEFNLTINEETKKQIIEIFDNLFIPNKNQFENWKNFIYPPNSLVAHFKKMFHQTKEMIASNLIHMDEADKAYEREKNES